MFLLSDCCKAFDPVYSSSLHRSTSHDPRLRRTRNDARAVHERDDTNIGHLDCTPVGTVGRAPGTHRTDTYHSRVVATTIAVRGLR